MPTPTLKHNNPYAKLFNKSPDYSFLRVFGCACYPLLRPYNSTKFAFRSKKCTFLGYSSNHRGYRCLDLDSGHVYLSRHVVFDENSFPFRDKAIFTRQTCERTSPTSVFLPPMIVPSTDAIAPPIHPETSTTISSPPPPVEPSHMDQGSTNSGLSIDFSSQVTTPPQTTVMSTITTAMGEEFDALQLNGTWSLTPRPRHKNVIRNKWVYKL